VGSTEGTLEDKLEGLGKGTLEGNISGSPDGTIDGLVDGFVYFSGVGIREIAFDEKCVGFCDSSIVGTRDASSVGFDVKIWRIDGITEVEGILIGFLVGNFVSSIVDINVGLVCGSRVGLCAGLPSMFLVVGG
jgi:hypothetical protein